MYQSPLSRFVLALALTIGLAQMALSKGTEKYTPRAYTKARPAVSSGARTPTKRIAVAVKASPMVASKKPVAAARFARTRYYSNPWKEPTFINDSTEGDVVDGEDPVVRQAALDALGNLNGTIVVTDPNTGKVLTIVNQKLALKSGFIPCSTIKILTAFAGLSEGVVERATQLRLSRYRSMNLTDALATSNNPYFAMIGEKLGFDRVIYYGRLFGLGERAGLDIADEQPGILPGKVPPEGVGMMTSFGSGIAQTPLELASMMGAIANGGTLYYLQHPRTQQGSENFVPRVKRRLDIEPLIAEVKPGLMGAVEYGTARRAGWGTESTILGKTGTCTDERSPTHMGWFGSYNDIGQNKLVVVVMLTGGRPINGPVASGIAGAVYRNLSNVNYFAQARNITPAALVSASCCRQ